MLRSHKLILIICLLATLGKAQTRRDFGTWTSLNLEHKVNDKFNLLFSESMRLKENATRLNQFYTEAGIEMKVIKKVKTSLSFRTTQRLDPENYFSFRHRLAWDINIKQSWNAFTFQYRHRLQSEIRKYYSSKTGKVPAWYERHKLQVKYELNKRLEPYIASEVQFQIKDPRNMRYNNEFHRIRFRFGCDVKLSTRKSIGVYYMTQNEFDIPDANNSYLIGIEYTIKL